MSNQIRITVEQMHTRVSQYRAEAENVNSVITTMDNLLNELQSEWEGAASESYAQRYRELRPSFIRAYELINEIAAALDKTAQIMGETDKQIAQSFRW